MKKKSDIFSVLRISDVNVLQFWTSVNLKILQVWAPKDTKLLLVWVVLIKLFRWYAKLIWDNQVI